MKNIILPAVIAMTPFMTQTSFAQADSGALSEVVEQCFANTDWQELAPDCVGAASDECQALPGGSTTVGMMECGMGEQKAWQVVLDREVEETRKWIAEGDKINEGSFPAVAPDFDAAQAAWGAFRDSDCQLVSNIHQSGTIRSLYFASCMLEETSRRAFYLRRLRHP